VACEITQDILHMLLNPCACAIAGMIVLVQKPHVPLRRYMHERAAAEAAMIKKKSTPCFPDASNQAKDLSSIFGYGIRLCTYDECPRSQRVPTVRLLANTPGATVGEQHGALHTHGALQSVKRHPMNSSCRNHLQQVWLDALHTQSN
jgi:hypothetical protein